MAKLNVIDLPDVDGGKSTRKQIIAVPVPGDIITRYNEACDSVKEAQKVIDRLKPDLIDAGLDYVFEHNHNCANDPDAQISSVNLLDERTGEVCQFSWLKKNLKLNAKAITAEFKDLYTESGKRVNINDYINYVPVAEFDASVFVKEGKFSTEIYEAFAEALAALAEKYNVANPLTVGKVLQPKPDFHSRRWVDFDAATNIALHAVIPTQVNLKPLRPDSE